MEAVTGKTLHWFVEEDIIYLLMIYLSSCPGWLGGAIILLASEWIFQFPYMKSNF